MGHNRPTDLIEQIHGDGIPTRRNLLILGIFHIMSVSTFYYLLVFFFFLHNICFELWAEIKIFYEEPLVKLCAPNPAVFHYYIIIIISHSAYVPRSTINNNNNDDDDYYD